MTACVFGKRPKQTNASTISGVAVLSSTNGFIDNFLSFSRRIGSAVAGLEEAKNLAGKVLRLIQDRLSDAECGKNAAKLSNQFAASANRRFEFKKRSELFICTHDKALPVAAMRVSNPDRSPVGINR